MAVAVLVAVVLQLTAPVAGRVVPRWTFPVVELLLLAVLMIRGPGRIDARGQGSRRATIGLVAVLTVATVGGVIVLIVDARSPGSSGTDSRPPDVMAPPSVPRRICHPRHDPGAMRARPF